MSKPLPDPIDMRRLSARAALPFELIPNADICTQIAARLDLLALRKLRFTGTLRPEGKKDWLLEAQLGATVVQPCVVTLAPVTTRIEEPLHRRYLAEMPALPDGEEVEMPEDDSAEPLPVTLDLSDVMEEALALALPQYPRADEAELGEAVYTEPGAQPLREADVKPFAGLAELKKRMEGD